MLVLLLPMLQNSSGGGDIWHFLSTNSQPLFLPQKFSSQKVLSTKYHPESFISALLMQPQILSKKKQKEKLNSTLICELQKYSERSKKSSSH